MSSLRTTYTKLHGDDYSALVRYQPGNGTRYDFLLTKLSDPQAKMIGAQDAICVAWLNPWEGTPRAAIFLAGSYLTPSYIQEKLGANEGDAGVLAEFLTEQIR